MIYHVLLCRPVMVPKVPFEAVAAFEKYDNLAKADSATRNKFPTFRYDYRQVAATSRREAMKIATFVANREDKISWDHGMLKGEWM